MEHFYSDVHKRDDVVLSHMHLNSQILIKFSKSLFLLLLIGITSGVLYGQEKVEVPLDNKEEWKIFYENDHVILSSVTRMCKDQAGGPSANFVFISLENKKNQTVLVEWHYNIYSSLECRTCNDPDNEYKFWCNLNPEQSIIPDCNSKKMEIEAGAKTIYFSYFLSSTDKESSSDVTKLVLADLMSDTIN